MEQAIFQGLLLGWLGLELEESQYRWAEQEHHEMAGNRVRRSRDSTIRLDDAWTREVTASRRLAILSLSALGRMATRAQQATGHISVRPVTLARGARKLLMGRGR